MNNDAELQEAFERWDDISQDPKVRVEYEFNEERETIQQYIRQQEQMLRERWIALATRMLSGGSSMEEVMEYTGFPESELKNVMSSINKER